MTLLRALLWFSYQLLLASIAIPTIPFFAMRRGGTGAAHYLPTLRGRVGLDLGRKGGEPITKRRSKNRGESSGSLWIHAVSVGEVGVAATLVRHFPSTVPLVVSTVTPTGQALARKLFADRAAVAYLPYDFAWSIRRFLDAHDPRALVLVEGDYWPLTLSMLRRRGASIGVANGRISNRAFGRQKRLGRINRLFYAPVSRFGVQTADDRNRLVALGTDAAKIEVTGNLKFDAPEPTSLPELETMLSGWAAGRPILVAGSTMEGEDEAVLEAFRHLGAGDKALLVIAPRHPERWDRVAGLIEKSGFRSLRRSSRKGNDGSEGEPTEGPVIEVLLLDSLGELAAVYELASAAFIGGTLVPTGGHNPLEPARFGVPTVVGPSMFNFTEMADTFDRAKAWRRAEDGLELGRIWLSWLEDPEAARVIGEAAADLLERNRGAAARTAEMLAPLLVEAGLIEPAASDDPRGRTYQ